MLNLNLFLRVVARIATANAAHRAPAPELNQPERQPVSWVLFAR